MGSVRAVRPIYWRGRCDVHRPRCHDDWPYNALSLGVPANCRADRRRLVHWSQTALWKNGANFPEPDFRGAWQTGDHSPSGRRPCKSVVKRKQNSPDARYGGARKIEHLQNPQLATCASRHWFLPSQNRTSICCLRPVGPSQKIEFVFTASPETIRGSLGSLRSFAQSATCGTWQPARCVILLSFPAAPVF